MKPRLESFTSTLARMSRGDWLRIAKINTLGFGGCVAVAIAIVGTVFADEEPRVLAKALVACVAVVATLTLPAFAYASMQILRLWFANRELAAYADRDGLTQVLNRRAFTTAASQTLDRMDTFADARGALLIIDADHFKAINDTWGHAQGDEALRRIAAALVGAMHRDDLIGRLGGEEFGVFLHGSSPLAARSVSERMRAGVEAIDLRSAEGEPIPLTISIGAMHFRGALPFAQLYQLADRNLYRAKASGRNCVVFEEAGVQAYMDRVA